MAASRNRSLVTSLILSARGLWAFRTPFQLQEGPSYRRAGRLLGRTFMRRGRQRLSLGAVLRGLVGLINSRR